jgi:hypothetical protein
VARPHTRQGWPAAIDRAGDPCPPEEEDLGSINQTISRPLGLACSFVASTYAKSSCAL